MSELVGCYTPETMKTLGKVFDDVWSGVEAQVGSQSIDRIRFTIANAIMILAQTGQSDYDRLRAYAADRVRRDL